MNKIVAVIIAIAALSGCGGGDYTAKVRTTIDAPLEITSTGLKSGSGDAWLTHQLTIQNKTGRTIVIDPNSVRRTTEFLNDNKLLLNMGCGQGSRRPEDELPIYACPLDISMPIKVIPNMPYVVQEVALVKGQRGMTPLDEGEYTWTRDIPWKYESDAEMQKAKLTVTYTVS